MMAGLPEQSQWDANVYQIEQTDPVVGGPPNLAQGDGITNVPHLALANRTVWLKAQIEALQQALSDLTNGAPAALDTLNELAAALGDDPNFATTLLGRIGGLGGQAQAAPGGNLDTVTVTTTLRIVPGDIGSPAPAHYGTLSHTEGDGGRAWQMAIMSDGRSYTRYRTDNAPTWSAWQKSWGNADAETLFSTNGYRIAPDGLITQWGTGSVSNGGPTLGGWPIAFPNAPFSIVGTDVGSGVHAIAMTGNETGWTAWSRTPTGTTPGTTHFRFMAIGW